MSSGDTWLSAYLPKIMNTPWYRHGGQIVISYDTGYQDGQGYNGSGGGRIPRVVVSAHTKGMGLVTAPHNTAGLLRSVEHVYWLPYLGDAADPNNGSLGGALVPGRPTGRPAAQIFHGAIVDMGTGAKGEVSGVRGQSFAFNGVYGLYAISCPTATTCEAVGYDTAETAARSAVTSKAAEIGRYA